MEAQKTRDRKKHKNKLTQIKVYGYNIKYEQYQNSWVRKHSATTCGRQEHSFSSAFHLPGAGIIGENHSAQLYFLILNFSSKR